MTAEPIRRRHPHATTFLRACKERPLSVAVYIVMVVLVWAFFPQVGFGFTIGFLFADYMQFTRSEVTVLDYVDEDFFQRKEPKP